MRQHHVAGEKAFVDYSGKRIGIVDPTTGEIREAEIFVGVLGASNLTYAEATWTQQLPDWTGAHVRMFRFFGGAPKLLVPDNLKSGVIKASFYDPEINRTYGAMAAYYSVGVLPARPYKPRDKAKVEAGVRFAQTYILGRLRALTFFSLAECNEAIALVMRRMNERPMRHLGLSRRELFEKIERDAFIPLPAQDWEFAEWRRARVNLDYHIEVHDFLYSVPHALIRAEVEVRVTARIVEVFHRGQRVAVHSAATWVASTARTPTTCPVPIGVTPNGRRVASAPPLASVSKTRLVRFDNTDLGQREPGRPSGRGPGLRRSPRHSPGRTDRRRASAKVRARARVAYDPWHYAPVLARNAERCAIRRMRASLGAPFKDGSAGGAGARPTRARGLRRRRPAVVRACPRT